MIKLPGILSSPPHSQQIAARSDAGLHFLDLHVTPPLHASVNVGVPIVLDEQAPQVDNVDVTQPDRDRLPVRPASIVC